MQSAPKSEESLVVLCWKGAAVLGGDEAANEDEDEVALMEIEEYVRMGVLLIYEELQPLQTTQTIH